MLSGWGRGGSRIAAASSSAAAERSGERGEQSDAANVGVEQSSSLVPDASAAHGGHCSWEEPHPIEEASDAAERLRLRYCCRGR